ncbi:hypothetical protein ACRRTK_018168 [Alexandromys fortis]
MSFPTTCALFHHEMSQSEFIIKQEARQPERLLLLDCWITGCISSTLNPLCSSIPPPPPGFLLCISKSTLRHRGNQVHSSEQQS